MRLRSTEGGVPSWDSMQASDFKHASSQGRQDTSSASGARGAQPVSAAPKSQTPNTNMLLRGRYFLPGLSNDHS